MSKQQEIQILTLANALVATGWRLWSTSLNNTPGAQLVFHWMREIAIGHLVLEITKSTSDRPLDRVGTLVAIASGHEYTIRTIDGRLVNWDNARFVRIPSNEVDNREILQLGMPPE